MGMVTDPYGRQVNVEAPVPEKFTKEEALARLVARASKLLPFGRERPDLAGTATIEKHAIVVFNVRVFDAVGDMEEPFVAALGLTSLGEVGFYVGWSQLGIKAEAELKEALIKRVYEAFDFEEEISITFEEEPDAS